MSGTSKRPWWRHRITLIGAVAVILVVAGGTVFLAWRAGIHQGAPSQTVAATTTTVQETVTGTGTLEPAVDAELSFASSGAVSSIDVEVGQSVTAGQKLATIDPALLKSNLTLAEAQVTQAQAAQSAAASSSSAQQAAAAAQVASAVAKRDAAEDALRGATLTSPVKGVVAAVNIAVGEQAGAGASSGTTASTSRSSSSSGATASGSAAISVISTDAWLVDTTVGSSDLASITPGLQVQITLAGSSQPIFGTVKSAGIVADSGTSGAAQFPVVVAVTGSPTGLYAGTSAAVSIIVKQVSDVLVVPTLAVRTENGKTVVTVRKNGDDVTTTITVGQVFGTRTQVTKGLRSGDLVVVQSFVPTGVTSSTGTGGRGFGGGFGGGSRTGGGNGGNGGNG